MNTSKPPGARTAHTLPLTLALITVALGCVTLLAWILDLPLLASFGAGRMPMAPSTAVLFLLFGAAICLCARTPLSRSAFRIGTVAGWLLALVALLLFVLSTLNIHPVIEHFGMNIDGLVGGAVTGHMSPVTAFCFLLAGVSFLAALSRSAIRPRRAALAWGSAGVLLGAAFIFLLAYGFGTPLLYSGTFIPPALNTILAFVTLGLALTVLAWRVGGLSGRAPNDGSRTAFNFSLIFVLLAAGIVSVSYIHYRNHEKVYRAEVERQLSAIAELKLSELMRWREDRLSDAAIFFKNPSFAALVRRFFALPADAHAQRQLLDWLGKYSTLDDYNRVWLLDTQGVVRLSLPADPEPSSPNTMRVATEALRSGQITIKDFYRSEHNQRVYLSVQIPIFDETDAHRPLGVLVLRIDPETFLYPFIKHWPTPSRTAETLLVRKDGNGVLYLNDIRHQTNAALALRLPLARTEVPSVRVALGQTGILSGVDYRGVGVLAAARAVPDSPWFLIAKMDSAEEYAPLRAQLWQTIGMIGAMLFGAGAGVGLVWRQQRVRHYKEKAEVMEALQKSQRLLTQAEKLGRVGGWEFDIETRQQTWTETVYDIHELDSTGRPAVDQGINYYTPASRPIIERAMQRAIEQGEPFDVELEIITAKGYLRSVHVMGKGDLARRKVSGFIQDITERKQAEEDLRQSRAAALNMMEDAIAARDRTEQAHEALRASEERHRTILHTAMDGIWLVDMQGRLLEVNAAYCRMSGYSAQELLAMRITDLEVVEETDDIAAHIQNIKAQGEDCFETSHRRKDGSIFYVEVSVQFRSDEGEQFVAFLHDITKRKRAEEEHAKLLVQFVQAQKMESVGRLAGGVAHDFNNLLMIIMGNADLCRDLIEPGHPIRELLDDITSGAQRSADITRQLLAFARKQTIAPKIVDLNDAVAGMLKLLQRLIGEDINLVWRPGADLPPVKIDPSQIDQILANLCVNSRDAIAGVGNLTLETGSITMDAEYCDRHAEAISGAYVILSVSDDGCGMNKETMAHVFEPFFTTKGLGKGTGLGLATVYGIVKQNNGFIYAYSEPGKGTTFKIYLPQIAAEAVATTVTSKTEAPRGRGETVLLVEDEKPLRVICGLFLEALDYKVLVAETPGEALKMTDRHPGDIHLLLTDVVMPGMNGRQLAKRISAVKPGIKVLYISGYTADVIAQRGVLDEGVQFLSKPFTRDALARKVRDVLEGPRPG